MDAAGCKIQFFAVWNGEGYQSLIIGWCQRWGIVTILSSMGSVSWFCDLEFAYQGACIKCINGVVGHVGDFYFVCATDFDG